MKRFFLLPLFAIMLMNCPSGKKTSESIAVLPFEENIYIKKYAGSYTIEVKGYPGSDIELQILAVDGTATWRWIEDGVVLSEKKGTWTATETEINIVTQGNTGEIVESFVLKDGVFTSGDRYLKKYEK